DGVEVGVLRAVGVAAGDGEVIAGHAAEADGHQAIAVECRVGGSVAQVTSQREAVQASYDMSVAGDDDVAVRLNGDRVRLVDAADGKLGGHQTVGAEVVGVE